MKANFSHVWHLFNLLQRNNFDNLILKSLKRPDIGIIWIINWTELNFKYISYFFFQKARFFLSLEKFKFLLLGFSWDNCIKIVAKIEFPKVFWGLYQCLMYDMVLSTLDIWKHKNYNVFSPKNHSVRSKWMPSVGHR